MPEKFHHSVLQHWCCLRKTIVMMLLKTSLVRASTPNRILSTLPCSKPKEIMALKLVNIVAMLVSLSSHPETVRILYICCL